MEQNSLISTSDASLVIEWIEQRNRGNFKLLAIEALKAAQTLMGLFPAGAFNDVAVFLEGLAALLSAYDSQFVRNILSPVDGIATRTKFKLTLFDVKEALEGEKAKRAGTYALAKWVIKELARIQSEAKTKDQQPLTPEEQARRAAYVARALKPFQTERSQREKEEDAEKQKPTYSHADKDQDEIGRDSPVL